MDRHTFLQSVTATVAMIAFPMIPSIAAMPVTIMPTLGPAWIVGTDGDWNWSVIRMPTESEAIAFWKEDHFGFVCDCPENEPDTCDGCNCGHEAERMPKWDDIDVRAGDATWFKAGMGANCSRCWEESFYDNGDHAVGNIVVCQGCMTLADWEIIDPEYAAELRVIADAP